MRPAVLAAFALLAVPGMASGEATLFVSQRVAGEDADAMRSTQCDLSLSGLGSLRAVEIHVDVSDGAGRELSTELFAPYEGMTAVPPFERAREGRCVLAMVFPRDPGEHAPKGSGSIPIASLSYLAASSVEPGIRARAHWRDGSNSDIDVRFHRILDQVSGSAGSVQLEVFPNPTGGPVRLEFSLPRAQPTSLTIYDVSGRQIRKVFDGPGVRGENGADWDLRDERGRLVSPGFYFSRLEAGESSLTRKIVLLDRKGR